MQTKTRSLWIINLFIIVAILVLGGTVYLTLVTAKVVIPSDREEFKNTAAVDVSATASDTAVYGDVVTKEYSETDTFPVGSQVTLSKKAGGTVTLINTTAKNQALVATTRLLTPDNKLFRITTSVQVPANGRVSAFAEADAEGDASLVGPTKFTIPGLAKSLQTQIYAESSSPMTFDRYVAAAITGDDIAKAEQKLTDRIVNKALEELQKNLADGAVVSKDLLTVKRILLIADPNVGEEASQTNVTLTVAVSALAVNPSDILRIAESKLIEQLPDKNALLEVVPGSLTYSIATLDAEAKQGQLNTGLSAWIKSNKATANIDLKQLTGKSKSEALQYLATLGISNATITLTPSWLPTLPLLKDHVRVEVK